MKQYNSIPEELLRRVWLKQQFSSKRLETTDGRSIVVIEPGQLNDDSGPDFRNARIRIGGILYSGDVEIHRKAKEWTLHAHDRDPRYNQVILHAVLYASRQSQCTKSGREIPALLLSEYLDISLLDASRETLTDEEIRRTRRINCSGQNDGIAQEVLEQWIAKLAQQRLELKLRKFHERLKQLIDESRCFFREPYTRYMGDPSEIPPPSHEYSKQDYARVDLWDQLIYEGVMEGLGYSKNREAMVTLARNVSLRFLQARVQNTEQEERLRAVQSILFGAAGLLPSSRATRDKEARSYLRDLRRRWKQIRPEYKRQTLHPAAWQFFRLRPQNFPTLRLAAASTLALRWSSGGMLRSIVHSMKDSSRDASRRSQLLGQLLHAPPDEFWSKHYTFDRTAGRAIKTLIGADRIDDIVINTFVPITLLYARIFRDRELRSHTMELLTCFPALSDNSLTRRMEQQLLKGKLGRHSAVVQQGVIQLFEFYCQEGRCLECEVGKLVFRSSRVRAHHDPGFDALRCR